MTPHETPTITPPTWRPIEDLPQGWEHLHTDQLRSLGEVWQRQREAQLDDSTVLQEFNERLSRQWAIETGIIEGLYTIDRGTTQVLIEHGIVEKNIPHTVTNRPLTLVAMLQDHQMVLEGAFDFVQQRRSLSTSYIKEIHAALTQHQPTTEAIDSLGRIATVELLRGEWKRHANNPTRPDGLVHPYCPPEHVAAEMDRLVGMHLAHMEQGVPPEVEAAWLHHRFTQIHPFQDGNGRVARVLASLVFLRAGWFPLSIDRDQRSTYIDALELADRGMLESLISLFARVQEREFFSAFVQLDNVTNQGVIEGAVLRDADSFTKQSNFLRTELNTELAEALVLNTYDELTIAVTQTRPGLHLHSTGAHVKVTRFRHYPINQASNSVFTSPHATKEEYSANTDVFNDSVTLAIERTDLSDIITFSFHGFGRKDVGLFAVTANRDVMTEINPGVWLERESRPLSDSVFVFSYDELLVSATERLRAWRNSALANAASWYDSAFADDV